MPVAQPSILTIVLPLLVVVAVLVIRGRRMMVKRPLKPATLWIVPAIFLVFAAMSFSEFPPHGTDFAWLAGALVLGVAFGWQRGRLMKIWVEPETGELMTQGSAWAVIFLVILIVVRTMLRTGMQYEAGTWAISPELINNTFIVFALGLFGTQRAEMAIRAGRLKGSGADNGTA